MRYRGRRKVSSDPKGIATPGPKQAWFRDPAGSILSVIEAEPKSRGPQGPRGANVLSVDEGLPIAYRVLDPGVPVYASGGEQVGTVEHVVAAGAEDIFHSIVMRTDGGACSVPAAQVASLHERGVDLRLDAAAVAELPPPDGGAPAWRIREPGAKPSRWKHLVDRMTGKNPSDDDWTKED